MARKTCLVTGGTSGVGRATACDLARRGANVILVGRSDKRCQNTVEAIQQETGNRAVEWLRADLSSQHEIHRLATEFCKSHLRLDVLVNNAGALFELRRESADGIEMTIALNHLGYFLLTKLLLSTLKASAPSRIIVVSSEAHRDVSAFDFDDPQAQKRASWRGSYTQSHFRSLGYCLLKPWAHPAFLQYAHSKLANLLFTYELARRLAGTGVTVNALHPGLVATKFSAGGGVYSWFLQRYTHWFGIDARVRAASTIYLATSPDVASVTAQYFFDGKPVVSSSAAQDTDAAHRLWEWSEQMTALSNLARDGD